MASRWAVVSAIIMTLVVGCRALEAFSDAPNPDITATPEEALATATTLPETGTAPQTLMVWLPPEFDPNDTENLAALALSERLMAFSDHRPGVRVDVRVKAEEGTAGLFNSLRAAQTAAPSAMPDVIALRLNDFREAVEMGLIAPIDESLLTIDKNEWYQSAQQAVTIDGTLYGLPFGLDSLALVYRNTVVEDPPTTWQEARTNGMTLSFPAADPNALASILWYQAQGGTLRDEDGLALSKDEIEDILTWYAEGRVSGHFPFWLTQYHSDDLAWQAFENNQANMAITWISRSLKNPQDTISAAALPTESGAAYTLNNAWVWAVVTPVEEKIPASVSLAEFLIEDEFLGPWSEAIGYFPISPVALVSWENQINLGLGSQILPNADILPSENDLKQLGEPLSIVIIRLLKGEINVEDALIELSDILAE